MGLFDFFRRLPAAGPKPDEDGPPGKPLAALSESRCDHYSLAHLALRYTALDDPLFYLGVMASPDAKAFLSDMLERVARQCGGEGAKPSFTADEIGIHPLRIGDHFHLIVELPTPRAVTEAYFTAAVVHLDPSRAAHQESDAEEEKPPVRYFTLEYGFTFDGPPRTVLAEWSADESHLNYGDGPPPRLDDFIAALGKLMQAPASPPPGDGG
ncbi:MAG TPA: hypothetical protein VGE52_12515 [Pirellulales bacterium]